MRSIIRNLSLIFGSEKKGCLPQTPPPPQKKKKTRNGYGSKPWHPRYPEMIRCLMDVYSPKYGTNRFWRIPKCCRFFMVHPFQLSNGPTSLHICDHPPSPRKKSLARPLGQGVLDGIVIVDQVVKIANTGLPAAEMHVFRFCCAHVISKKLEFPSFSWSAYKCIYRCIPLTVTRS